MKILIYGAGIIGSTYGWQLAEAGHDITVLVRKGQRQITEQGIHLICQDFRNGKKKTIDTIFHPHVIDELDAQNGFEYIVVATNKTQLYDVLPVLGASAGKAHVLFFQNNWDCFDEIAYYLKPEQYFFGFPFMVGGGREVDGIHSVISGLKYSHTPIGEVNGEITPRVRKMVQALEDARLPLLISVPIAKKIYSNDALQLMFDGHINHSPEEVRQMIEDMIDNGIKYDIATPCLRKLKEML